MRKILQVMPLLLFGTAASITGGNEPAFSSYYSTNDNAEAHVRCGTGIVEWYRVFDFHLTGNGQSYDDDNRYISDSCVFCPIEITQIDTLTYNSCIDSVDITDECCHNEKAKCIDDCINAALTQRSVIIGDLLSHKGWSYRYGPAFEWRLAAGVPFAIIYRRKGYAKNDKCINDKGWGRADAEYLFVQSLPGSGLSFTDTINVRSCKDANVLARKITDKHYLGRAIGSKK